MKKRDHIGTTVRARLGFFLFGRKSKKKKTPKRKETEKIQRLDFAASNLVMRSASPLAASKGRRSLSRHQGAPATISRHLSRSYFKVPETRKQQRQRQRHLQFASASADNPGLDLDLDLSLSLSLDRARFPLLTSPCSPISHFVNLTSGLEAVPALLALGIHDFTVVRLTSTACEQRRHADFLSEVDASLLAALAAGRVALVWDTSSRERGGGGGRGGGAGDEEWREALLADAADGGGEPGLAAPSRSPRSLSRAGGGLRVPRALFWGLEFLRYACESRWNGGREASGASEGGGGGGGGAAAAAGAAASPSSPPPPPPLPPLEPPPPKAFLGEAGHDVTADFEQALRKEVPDGTKARVRYFRRFYQQQQQRQQLRASEGGSRFHDADDDGDGDGDGGKGIRLWGCYRPSRLDGGGGDEASRSAQEALFTLAFSSSCRGELSSSGSSGSRSREEGEDSTVLPLPLSPPPPPFSREALALELAELGWGLFTGGKDRAKRLRASRRRREAKREE